MTQSINPDLVELMTEIRVASWHAQNAFGDSERDARALEVVRRLDADVLYLPEFADGAIPPDQRAFYEDVFDRPQLVMGDFNAVDARDHSPFARTLRLARPFTEVARRAMGDRVDFYDRTKRVPRQLGRVVRLADMAADRTFDVYHEVGLEQLDPELAPTIALKPGGTPVVRIDHILGRNVAVLGHDTVATSVSDHVAVRAELAV